MQIMINIPKEFESHFNSDGFEDSLQRIKLDVVDSIYCTEASLSGKYEIETIDMLIKAFKECTPLPKNKAPEQEEPVLDKIKAEIIEEKDCAYADFEEYKVEYLGQDWEDVEDSFPQDDFRYGMERCIEILNKYRTEN